VCMQLPRPCSQVCQRFLELSLDHAMPNAVSIRGTQASASRLPASPIFLTCCIFLIKYLPETPKRHQHPPS
jgi:hypothetical protein